MKPSVDISQVTATIFRANKMGILTIKKKIWKFK